MTETVPERIWVSAADADNDRVLWEDPDEGGTEYVPATALEAAQARIRELETEKREAAMQYLADAGQLTDALATARREALEEAANTERDCLTHVTDAYRLGWSDAMKIRTERIHALMEKPNG